MPAFEITGVDASNVERIGLCCAMSKPGALGYQEKLAWAKERFAEGLRIKVLAGPSRGFIEYMPGKMTWRAIEAPGYMVIHCLWVVGKAKGKGAGKALLETCLEDARQARAHGVAAVTARDKTGFVDTEFFLHQGFHIVQSTASGVDLVVRKFHPASADPHFPIDLKKKARALGDGLTVVSTPQCPYSYEAAQQLVSLAHADQIPRARSLRLNTLAQVRQTAPSPYASLDVVYGGEVVCNLFHNMSPQRLQELVDTTLPPKHG